MPTDPPFDEIHQTYIRMTELAERLLEHPQFREVATDPRAGELLGGLHAVGQEAAKLKILTERLSPGLHAIWQDVLRQA